MWCNKTNVDEFATVWETIASLCLIYRETRTLLQHYTTIPRRGGE